MPLLTKINQRTKLVTGMLFVVMFTLAGCGGGSTSNSATDSHPTPAQIAAITPAQIASYSGAQVVALGVDMMYLSDAALNALTYIDGPGLTPGQIPSITAAQIAALSPSQVRMIGAAGPGGTVATSQIKYLNTGAWAALASDPAQVAAITPAEIPTLSDSEIVAMGVNIKYLSDAALNALTPWTYGNSDGQIQSISAAEIAALSPAQVRMIGAAGPGGSIGTSQIQYLNTGAWSALVSNPAQVAAITPAEIQTLLDSEIVAMGANIKYLSDASLNALSYMKNFTTNLNGQIESLTVTQIAALSPAQVRMIGAAGVGGAITTSQIQYLNTGAWGALVSDQAQVAAITPAEIQTLWDSEIVAMGASIGWLSDAALGALSPNTNMLRNIYGQIQSLTVTQITALTPAQFAILAGVTSPYGPGTAIAYFNVGASSALSANQVAVLAPANVVGVSAAQLASLSLAAIAGFTPATIASFTATQKSLLSPEQLTACGC